MANSYSEIGTSSGTGSGSGDVTGPASSNGGSLAIFSDSTGKVIEELTIEDSGFALGSGTSTAHHIASFNKSDGQQLEDSGVNVQLCCLRSGNTTNAHIAVWDGTNAASLKDGGAVPTGSSGTVEDCPLTGSELGITSNASYTALAGMTKTITAIAGERVLVITNIIAYPSAGTGFAAFILGYSLDGGSNISPMNIFSVPVEYYQGATGMSAVFILPALNAGSVTISLYAKLSSSSNDTLTIRLPGTMGTLASTMQLLRGNFTTVS